MAFSIFRILGFTGTFFIVLGIVSAALLYHGKKGERFSLFNHFISELGEVGISRAAWAFNLGLILGGLALIPSIIGLGLRVNSLLGWLGTGIGVIALLGVTAVGFYPMNDLTTHGRAAMTYFRAGLGMVFFFGLAILFQPANTVRISQFANLFSLLAFLAYGAFLLLLARSSRKHRSDPPLDPQQEPERPRFWLMAMLEWAVFFSTVLWLFGMAFQL